MRIKFWKTLFSQRDLPLLPTEKAQYEYLTRLICKAMLAVVGLFWLATFIGWRLRFLDHTGVIICSPILLLCLLLVIFNSKGYWNITRIVPIVLFFILGIYGSVSLGAQTSIILFYVISFILAGLLISKYSMIWCIVAALVIHIGIIQVFFKPSIEFLITKMLISISSFSAIGFIFWISINLHQSALEKCKQDSLTGLNNRSFFDAEIERLDFGRQFPVTVIYADVNNLKLANDQYGHPAGDRLLQISADLLRAATRIDDVLCRLGGDEFAIICLKSDETVAAQIQERIQDKIDQYNASADIPISLAVGTATTIKPGTLLETVREADDRMYINKAEQKRRLVKSN